MLQFTMVRVRSFLMYLSFFWWNIIFSLWVKILQHGWIISDRHSKDNCKPEIQSNFCNLLVFWCGTLFNLCSLPGSSRKVSTHCISVRFYCFYLAEIENLSSHDRIVGLFWRIYFFKNKRVHPSYAIISWRWGAYY